MGKLLARELLIDFIDTDNEIESKTGISIEKIFEEKANLTLGWKELVENPFENKVTVVSPEADFVFNGNDEIA